MKIGLALSGGGAMGAAHIGLIEELVEGNIKIDAICGTSAGAIAGLLYSYGGIPILNKFFLDMEKAGLFSRTKIIFRKNETIFAIIEELLRDNVKVKHFSDLNVKFSCVASDLETGGMVHLKSGDPIKAVMASAAYPGVFPVQRYAGHHLIDGGVTRSLPAGSLREEGMDFVIGSSLYSIEKLDKFDSDGKLKVGALSVALRALDILEKELAEYEIKNCDYCFFPKTDEYRWYEFHKIHELREAGNVCAKAHISDLKLAILSKSKKSKTIWQKLFGA